MLDDKTLEEWKEKLQQEIFFWVGIEIKNRNQGTFIDIVRYFAGDKDKIPTIEEGLVGHGDKANRLLIEQLLKSAADSILKDASDEIIDSIALSGGELNEYIKDLFVDAYFKMEFMRIVNTTINYDDFEKIMDVGEEKLVGGREGMEYLKLLDELNSK